MAYPFNPDDNRRYFNIGMPFTSTTIFSFGASSQVGRPNNMAGGKDKYLTKEEFFNYIKEHDGKQITVLSFKGSGDIAG